MKKMERKKTLERVKIEELSLYLRAIYQQYGEKLYLQYGEKSHKEYSELVSKEFNVICTEQDVENLHLAELNLKQDFELIAMRTEYFRNLNKPNPYE